MSDDKIGMSLMVLMGLVILLGILVLNEFEALHRKIDALQASRTDPRPSGDTPASPAADHKSTT